MPLLAGGSSAIELTNGLDDEYGENWWGQAGGFRSRPSTLSSVCQGRAACRLGSAFRTRLSGTGFRKRRSSAANLGHSARAPFRRQSSLATRPQLWWFDRRARSGPCGVLAAKADGRSFALKAEPRPGRCALRAAPTERRGTIKGQCSSRPAPPGRVEPFPSFGVPFAV
jgi:hypothetical protein